MPAWAAGALASQGRPVPPFHAGINSGPVPGWGGLRWTSAGDCRKAEPAWTRCAGSGQRHVRRLGHDNLAALVLEPRQQTEPPLRAACVVPGQPEAVGRAQVRFALVDRQVLGREHKLLFRAGLAGSGRSSSKAYTITLPSTGTDFCCVPAKEHDPPAEAAHRRFAGLVQRRVGPDRQHVLRRLRFGFRFQHREGFAQVPLAQPGRASTARRPAGRHDGLSWPRLRVGARFQKSGVSENRLPARPRVAFECIFVGRDLRPDGTGSNRLCVAAPACVSLASSFVAAP